MSPILDSTTFNASWDALKVLENWTENGIAPDHPVVTDTFGVPGRTRPLCDYPGWPKYRGSGDVDRADSFVCAAP
ncbi:tannase/feruloyl esterase family alpha/beta hydrolase [Pseudoduganella chitinolytica]|uniref:tannase/feruloyl esterase family alpha/beta hydrolase n=1 Tax=Pseudoduganella chitinolytica TaxID=34070 RepID=UPI0035316ADC